MDGVTGCDRILIGCDRDGDSFRLGFVAFAWSFVDELVGGIAEMTGVDF